LGREAGRVKRRFKSFLAEETDIDSGDAAAIKTAFEVFIRRERLILRSSETESLLGELIREIVGYGTLTPYFCDPEVTEIMVNGNGDIYLEKHGALESAGENAISPGETRELAERMLGPLGLRIDESSPYANGRLKDGSRINVVIPPLSVDGPILTVRRFPDRALTADDLCRNDSWKKDEMRYLRTAVRARKTILISGGTGSGKTTLLNVLAGFAGDAERLVTVEDTAELRIPKRHVIRLQSRPENVEGRGEVTIRDLVRNALRMRRDRLIVGEARGPEALDMLQAMNTGHDGSFATVHANSCQDALRRLEVMAKMAGERLPLPSVQQLVNSAIDIVVQTARVSGARKVAAIYDVKAGLYVTPGDA
jgi:pilus assembly protein CpaF